MMTIQEASRRYQIPMELLRAYEGWGLGKGKATVEGQRQYDDTDLERLGMAMILGGLGFTQEEIKTYLYHWVGPVGDGAQCLRMLEDKRSAILEEIHAKEHQLQRLDYLRHQMRNQERKKEVPYT